MENDETEFSLKEWDSRARIISISRQNTGSRRFSASHVRTLREEARSFRSNFTVSSTASSPGYILRDEIDPSTYSFTNALKALQAKQRYVNVWDSLSPEGFVLNSKWSDAERYICNPLSGEVPIECLSAKTLSQRSFRNVASGVTMSAPLVYPSHYPRNVQPRPPPSVTQNLIQGKNLLDSEVRPFFVGATSGKAAVGRTRDVGTQSTASDIVMSRSPSAASTPSIAERNVKRCISEAEDSLDSESKVISAEERGETREGIDDETENNGEEGQEEDENSHGQVCMKCKQGGCLSWMMVVRRRRRRKKKKKNHKPRRSHIVLFFPRMKGC